MSQKHSRRKLNTRTQGKEEEKCSSIKLIRQLVPQQVETFLEYEIIERAPSDDPLQDERSEPETDRRTADKKVDGLAGAPVDGLAHKGINSCCGFE